ncbi:uncharacterized protein [Populus alba]|uniref:High mobility group nucleosome-binding domain-containing protein 5-like isoform X1 n=2 Tax=Populus alba TaxID=43335 RepID=A0A4U5N8V0_POPAL|nr:cilia- and flagella-associated protein 251-like [Populus alba]TKR78924.1 high mobility group nucleosome-binding domain-containing protein 5-like isoform X1 [Populus alba]
MENNIATKQANLPSNYVTLGQLQERWIKEQQRKQTEKEQQEEHDHKKLHNEVAEPGQLSPSVSVSPPSIRRNSNRESHRWSLVGTNVEESKAVSVADLEENVDEKREEMKTKKRGKGNERKEKKKGEARVQEEGEVTGNLIGTNVEESKAVSVAVLEENVNDKREEMKTKKKSWKRKSKKKGEARAQEEEGEVTGNLIGTNVEESKAVLVAVLEENVNDKREEMKTKKKSWKRTGKKKGEARAQEEQGKVTGNLIVTNVEELKALPVAVLEENVNEKREEMKTKKIWKGKGKGKGMKGEARAKEEEWGLTGSGAQALLVKSEKNNVGCERKREMRVECRAEAEKAAEENNQTVEIEKEIGDLSVKRESEKSKTPNKVINGRISNRESKDYSGYANRGHWNYRGGGGGGYRGNGQYRGGYGRFNGENGRYAGGHGSGYGQWKERHNAKVWMKKEEAGDGGDMARNQSSSVSSKELE